VEETNKRGWWIPGGAVEAAETFQQAATRECWEEAGVHIKLRGILKIERFLHGEDKFKMRVIFYAEPRNPDNCTPKQTADQESNGAEWVTQEEFKQKEKIRGDELLIFAEYLEKKGLENAVFPLEMFEDE